MLYAACRLPEPGLQQPLPVRPRRQRLPLRRLPEGWLGMQLYTVFFIVSAGLFETL